jgi:hypothetical protein
MSMMQEGRAIHLLPAAVRAFRIGMEGLGSENLMHFIDHLLPELGKLPPERVAAFNLLLQGILQGQAQRDFLTVADLLEYQLMPFLAQEGILSPSGAQA